MWHCKLTRLGFVCWFLVLHLMKVLCKWVLRDVSKVKGYSFSKTLITVLVVIDTLVAKFCDIYFWKLGYMLIGRTLVLVVYILIMLQLYIWLFVGNIWCGSLLGAHLGHFLVMIYWCILVHVVFSWNLFLLHLDCFLNVIVRSFLACYDCKLHMFMLFCLPDRAEMGDSPSSFVHQRFLV